MFIPYDPDAPKPIISCSPPDPRYGGAWGHPPQCECHRCKGVRDNEAIIKAVDRLRKASRLVGSMALDWMLEEEAKARRDLLRLLEIEGQG